MKKEDLPFNVVKLVDEALNLVDFDVFFVTCEVGLAFNHAFK
jgi:hypothetical protein